MVEAHLGREREVFSCSGQGISLTTARFDIKLTTLSLGVMVHGSSLPKPCLLILLKLCHQQASHSLQAFLDSASQKELQCFLGFPTFIFNQRFIRDYSKVASPHTGLIFPKLCLCLVHRSRSSLLKTEDSVHICVSVGSLSHQTPFLW